jgi:alkylated DNA repair dioxygenase AlkB
MSPVQLSLLDCLPEGFEYRADLMSPEEEAELIEQFRKLDLREFEFHGFLGKRRVMSFGQHYDFAAETLHNAEEIPAFLLPLRQSAADFARIAASELPHALVTEYAPGAAIGWHRDRPVYKDVIGISFVSPCRFRLRRKWGDGWQRASKMLAPRSVYLLRGPVRTQWQHSIPPVEQLRYSVTFRSLNVVEDP